MAVDVSQLGAEMATMHLNGLPIPHLPYEIFLQVVEGLIADAISDATEHPLSLSIQQPDARDEIHGKHKILLGKHQFIRQTDISHRLDLVRNFHQIDRKTRRMVASSLVQLPITTFECGVTYIWMCPRVDAFQIIFPLSFLRSLRQSPALHLIEHVAVNPVEACFTMFPEIVEILTALPALKSVTLMSYFGVNTNAHIPRYHQYQHENVSVIDEKSVVKVPSGFELSGPSWAPIWERKVAFYLTGYYKNYLFRRDIQIFRHQDGAGFGSKSSSDGSLLIRRLDPFS